MAVFKINGVTLTHPDDLPVGQGIDATRPSGHYITNEPPNFVRTAGGVIAVEPASGNVQKVTWVWDSRSTRAVKALLDAINTDNGGLVVIDSPGITKVGYGAPVQYTGLLCTVHLPDFRVEGNADRVAGFEITFQLCFPQL